MKTYLLLSMNDSVGISKKMKITKKVHPKQQMLLERGYAFLAFNYYNEAIEQFKLAINEDPKSLIVPVILLSMAEAYEKTGEFTKAKHEINKFNLLEHFALL